MTSSLVLSLSHCAESVNVLHCILFRKAGPQPVKYEYNEDNEQCDKQDRPDEKDHQAGHDAMFPVQSLQYVIFIDHCIKQGDEEDANCSVE